MSEMHANPDRVVWFDLPVADLERASRFYAAVLGIKVHQEKAGSFSFAVLEHGADGNGGCLIPNAKDVSAAGILVYMNVDGRIHDAVRQAERLESEGNRIALYSGTDK
jgi:uncharacterized protein